MLRHPGRALGRLGQRRLFGAALLAWMLLTLFSAGFWGAAVGLVAMVPTDALVGAFFSQQIALLGVAWLKLLHLALAVELLGNGRTEP